MREKIRSRNGVARPGMRRMGRKWNRLAQKEDKEGMGWNQLGRRRKRKKKVDDEKRKTMGEKYSTTKGNT